MGLNFFDVVIIGSGFGGAMVAYPLVEAGAKVIMLERGSWVKRGPHNWNKDQSLDLTPYYSMETPYHVLKGGRGSLMGSCSCVGGQSVFSGAVSIRFRENDFSPELEITKESGAKWPIAYQNLESYYSQAEQILNVAGESGSDPTEPYRSNPYTQTLGELSQTSRKIAKAAKNLGLKPFRLPLAINYSDDTDNQKPCENCINCDTFACAVQSKNDVATCVIPALLKKGLVLKEETHALRLITKDKHVTSVECYDKKLKKKTVYMGKLFISSAGALASPHILLSSGLQRFNPGGDLIGRYLMRHCNAIVYGIFPYRPNKKRQFHKQLGFNDFYYGHPTISKPQGKLGTIQQIHAPPIGLIHALLPKPCNRLIGIFVNNLTGFLVMIEDQPQYCNNISLDYNKKNQYSLPGALVKHVYTERDYDACNALVRKAKQILRNAGAIFCCVHKIKTFSHAVGTVRMGEEPNNSVLDRFSAFRGLKNLFVVDGSFMPTSGCLNPSLTIAANALRVGDHIAQNFH